MLLKADADGPGWADSKIAKAYNSRVQTIENLRKRLATEKFELALNRKMRLEPATRCKLDGAGEAKLIAMRLGKPPDGYEQWTLQLLADEMVVFAKQRGVDWQFRIEDAGVKLKRLYPKIKA